MNAQYETPITYFNHAIASGRLSGDESAPLYAGNFMFMGKDAAGKALFKNIATREYLKD